MTRCEEVGRWITDTIVSPLDGFFKRAHEQCDEARDWVEHEVREKIESWREQQEQRCQERECNWLCLCCNKWFCWLVTVLVSVLEWVVRVVGEWVVQVVCHVLVELIHVVVATLVQIAKWVAEAVVCLVERACSYLVLLVGVAVVAVLVGVVTSAASLFMIGLPALAAGAAVAISALLLSLRLCEVSRCRLLGVLVWAFKWAIVLGALVAVVALNAGSGLIVVTYGGVVAALIQLLMARACPVPRLLAQP